MSGKLSSLSRRVAKLEQQRADRKRGEQLANCICCESTMTHEAEKFEAEMNRTCPVHGFRRLGIIVTMTIIESDGTVAEESVKLRQLVDTYHLRLSQLPKSSCELEDDSEELDERYEIHIFVPAPATVGIRRTFQNRKHGFAQQILPGPPTT